MATISVETRAAVIISPEEYKQLLLDQIRLESIVAGIETYDWDDRHVGIKFDLKSLEPEVRAMWDKQPDSLKAKYKLRALSLGTTTEYIADKKEEEVSEDDAEPKPTTPEDISF
jgi:hypothetical protein